MDFGGFGGLLEVGRWGGLPFEGSSRGAAFAKPGTANVARNRLQLPPRISAICWRADDHRAQFQGMENLFIQIQMEGHALLADLAMNFEFLRLSASYVRYKETKSNDQTTPLGRHG